MFIRTPILKRGRAFEILVNGQTVTAYEGESLAAALLACGDVPGGRDVSVERLYDQVRLFCGMGACFGCLVTVDGVSNVRACVTAVRKGMEVTAVRSR